MKILTYDHGLCLESAITLARAGHHVGYYTPNDDAFPKPTKSLIGTGFKELERVNDADWDEAFSRADLVFCPDTHSKKIVDQCRREHKPVWGAGAAERLELDRLWMKHQQLEVGLPVGPYRKFVGVEALTAHLKTAKNVWVKVSSGEYRGVIETFKHESWNATRAQVLGQLQVDFADDPIVFLVEDPIDGPEVGGDYWWVRGQRVGNGYGYECKDEAYVGTCHETLPPVLAEVDEHLRKIPEAREACSFVSTEVIVPKDGKGVLIDPTLRAPHPPMAGMLELYPSWTLLVSGTAAPNDTTTVPTIRPASPYVAVLVIRSEWAAEHRAEVEFPERLRRWVKLAWAYQRDGHFFALPGNSFVAYAVGLGRTVQAAADAAKKVADEVHVRERICRPDALDELIEGAVAKGRNVGIPF